MHNLNFEKQNLQTQLSIYKYHIFSILYFSHLQKRHEINSQIKISGMNEWMKTEQHIGEKVNNKQ